VARRFAALTDSGGGGVSRPRAANSTVSASSAMKWTVRTAPSITERRLCALSSGDVSSPHIQLNYERARGRGAEQNKERNLLNEQEDSEDTKEETIYSRVRQVAN
jgi:hypothetical protein